MMKEKNITPICLLRNKISCLFIKKAAILREIAAFLFVVVNVLRLKNVAKIQHQAFTNIHKTLNLVTAPFQKFPN